MEVIVIIDRVNVHLERLSSLLLSSSLLLWLSLCTFRAFSSASARSPLRSRHSAYCPHDLDADLPPEMIASASSVCNGRCNGHRHNNKHNHSSSLVRL